jgi:hypothetical protein
MSVVSSSSFGKKGKRLEKRTTNYGFFLQRYSRTILLSVFFIRTASSGPFAQHYGRLRFLSSYSQRYLNSNVAVKCCMSSLSDGADCHSAIIQTSLTHSQKFCQESWFILACIDEIMQSPR